MKTAEMEAIQQQLVNAMMNERADNLEEAKLLCKKGSLPEGSKKL